MYKVLIIPLITIALTQCIKILIDIRQKNFSWYRIVSYGGMPSSHSSAMSSLATVVALHDGIFSTTFSITLVSGLLIIRDALGLRRYVGLHAKRINTLIKSSETKTTANLEILHERTGHTPLQVTVGIVFGIIVAFVLYTYL